MLTQLTAEQIKARSDEKMTKIRTLCEELQITFAGKQRLDPTTMVLENVVIFTDNENYSVLERGPETKKSPAQTQEEIANNPINEAVEPAEEKTDVEPANI